jgi:uncharacterized protein DUF3800
MRIAYLDEAGTGNIDNEPIVVVAGVIVHADGQWRAVEDRLKDLVTKYIREEDRTGFCFHGTDIYSGSKLFTLDRYPREQRSQMLEELCRLPHDLSLPIVYGPVNRKEMREKYPAAPPDELLKVCLGIAASVCMFTIERYMRTRYPDEVAFVVHENNEQSRDLVRSIHNEYRNPHDAVKKFQDAHNAAYGLPFKNIIDTAHFAEKRDTPILQLADICAFVIKRRLMGKPYSDRYIAPMEGQIVIKNKDGWPKIEEAKPR